MNALLGEAHKAELHELVLNPADPLFQSAKKIIFFGLSGSPPTTAHAAMLEVLARLYQDCIVLLVPASNLYVKRSIACVNTYSLLGMELRIALQMEMVQVVNESLAAGGLNPNVRASLHEQGVDRGLATFLSIAKVAEYGKLIEIVGGADTATDICNRRWNYAKALATEIGKTRITLSYFSHGAPPNFIKILTDPPIDASKWYGTADDKASQDRAPFHSTTMASAVPHDPSLPTAEMINSNIININDKLTPADLEKLSTAEGVSSTAARLFIAAAARDPPNFTNRILYAPLRLLPLHPRVRFLLVNYDGRNEGRLPPYSDAIACTESAPKTEAEAAAIIASVDALVPVATGTISPTSIEGGRRRKSKKRSHRKSKKSKKNKRSSK